jgi:hypothetical protein
VLDDEVTGWTYCDREMRRNAAAASQRRPANK